MSFFVFIPLLAYTIVYSLIMIEIFRDISPVKVGYYQSVLEEQGIQTFVRNENLALTEVPIPVFYPALCILNDEDYEHAIKILQETMKKEQAEAHTPDITCPKCKEENPASFETCWSCSEDIK